MTDATLQVVRAGLHTTVQDDGRWGHQHLGVPVGGALDQDALRRANVLVGNAAGEAVLEVTLTGCAFRTTSDTHIAVTGARFAVTVDGRPVPMDVALSLPAGALLDVGVRTSGARACIAVRGGIDGPRVLGSRSAWPLAERRGALVDGQHVALGRRAVRPVRSASLPGLARHDVLRVIPTHEASPEAVHALVTSPYRVSPASNRMAMPLDGPPVALPAERRASSGTVAGAIQITPEGRPILLLAERQTTGGYPVVAVVITADLPHAAQQAPGDAIRFATCTREDALEALWRAEAHWGRP
ncbi:MAG TPA: biotin-dependent carboxyltransferase family protein [Luteitalea sp.]|nr:biotin-dependent carboxyltransferase family protein [Luteitalea sp.]